MPATSARGTLHSAFYRFVHLPDPCAAAGLLRTLGQGLRGSIVVAPEGINGTLAGAPALLQAFEASLQQVLGGALRGMVFKHSECVSEPFGRLRVGVRPQIVTLELPDAQRLPAPDERDASHLSPLVVNSRHSISSPWLRR